MYLYQRNLNMHWTSWAGKEIAFWAGCAGQKLWLQQGQLLAQASLDIQGTSWFRRASCISLHCGHGVYTPNWMWKAPAVRKYKLYSWFGFAYQICAAYYSQIPLINPDEIIIRKTLTLIDLDEMKFQTFLTFSFVTHTIMKNNQSAFPLQCKH